MSLRSVPSATSSLATQTQREVLMGLTAGLSLKDHSRSQRYSMAPENFLVPSALLVHVRHPSSAHSGRATLIIRVTTLAQRSTSVRPFTAVAQPAPTSA